MVDDLYELKKELNNMGVIYIADNFRKKFEKINALEERYNKTFEKTFPRLLFLNGEVTNEQLDRWEQAIRQCLNNKISYNTPENYDEILF